MSGGLAFGDLDRIYCKAIDFSSCGVLDVVLVAEAAVEVAKEHHLVHVPGHPLLRGCTVSGIL